MTVSSTQPDYSVLRLTFRGVIRVATIDSGTIIYNQLKNNLLSIDPHCMFSGEILRVLDPCCGQTSHVSFQK
jgi:hypothetical protein